MGLFPYLIAFGRFCRLSSRNWREKVRLDQYFEPFFGLEVMKRRFFVHLVFEK
jgi:hypothetical protein